MVLKAKEDFPLPLNPVMTTNWFLGILTSIFFRLFSRAPSIIIELDEMVLGTVWPGKGGFLTVSLVLVKVNYAINSNQAVNALQYLPPG